MEKKLEYLQNIDAQLFHYFNSVLVCGFLDWFMPIITNAKLWMPFIILAWLGMLIFGSKRYRVLALLLLLGAGLTDFVCARIIKKAVGRIRPCAVENIDGFKCRLLLHKKNSKSFPSNHAANNAAFATVIWMYCGPKLGAIFAVIAFLVGYSRVYVGVHYPFDVVAGWLFGFIISYICVKLFKYKFPEYFNDSNKKSASEKSKTDQNLQDLEQ